MRSGVWCLQPPCNGAACSVDASNNPTFVASNTKPDCSCVVINYQSLQPEAPHLPGKLPFFAEALGSHNSRTNWCSVYSEAGHMCWLWSSTEGHLGSEAQVSAIRQSQNYLTSRAEGLFMGLTVQR